MKPTRLLFSLAALLACSAAHATITIEIDADYLTTSANVAAPDGSALFLVADESGAGFGLPQAGTYSFGTNWGGPSFDDKVVDVLPVDSSSIGITGVIDTQIDLSLSSVTGWAVGQHLGLYWLPSDIFSSGSATITPGAGYGFFNFNSVGSDSSTWVTPADGTTPPPFVFHSALAQNLDASNDVPTYGTVPSAVPEPSTFALLGGVVCLAFAVYRRRKNAAFGIA
jgi:hypothetical protein